MSKVITEEKLIDEFLERGVEQVFPSKEELKKVLISGKKLKVYCGYDPSAPALHIGNAITMNKLAQFQKMGHEIIFLIGDFTGMIGDPTDKTATRKKMTREEVLKNAEDYQKQAAAYLDFDGDNPAKVLYNSQWNDILTYKELIEITSNFTAQQMMARDMFQERIKEGKPIYLHEFLYPVTQAYDSVAMKIDLEVGGNDQMFNMMCGRDLVSAMLGKEKFVLTMKLLADKEGKKMGKSEGNVVWLSDTPQDMFGKIMSWSDDVIGLGFELCTNIPMTEVKKAYEELEKGKVNPRDYKIKLAYEITKINYGEKEAQTARDYFVKTFSKREIPEEVLKIEVKENVKISDAAIMAGLAKSKSDARRKIEQGGVYIENNNTLEAVISDRSLSKDDDGKILKVGKKDFRKIKII